MEQIQLETIISILNEIQPLGKYEADTALFDSGYIDSLIIFDRLLPKLEEIYEITVEPPELIPDHFETPKAILEYVKNKRDRM